MLTQHRRVRAVSIAALLALGSVSGAGSAFATGTCPGTRTEYILAAQQKDVSELEVYDVNRDGVICQAIRARKTTYSDNRP